MNLIATDNEKKLKYWKKTQLDPSYIAGMIDGDGTISIRKQNDSYTISISLSQCRTNILQILAYYYGGQINGGGNKGNCNYRNQYTYKVTGRVCEFLLDDILPHLVLKYRHAELIKEIIPFNNKPNFGEKKEKLYLECAKLNKTKERIPKLERIDIAYIAGLFDAEGSISCGYNPKKQRHNLRIKLTQLGCKDLLFKIKDVLGFGRVTIDDNNAFWFMYKHEEAGKLYNLINKYLIVKRNQMEQVYKYINSSSNEVDKRTKIYKIIQNEKKENEEFRTNKKLNIQAFMERKKKKEDEINKQKKEETIIRKEKQYQDKSEKMKGEGNHNFGKKRSVEEEYKKAVTQQKKLSPPDDVIIDIQNQLKNGILGTVIQKKYKLSKKLVTKIKQGLLVPIPEFTLEFFIKRKNGEIKSICGEKKPKMIELDCERCSNVYRGNQCKVKKIYDKETHLCAQHYNRIHGKKQVILDPLKCNFILERSNRQCTYAIHKKKLCIKHYNKSADIVDVVGDILGDFIDIDKSNVKNEILHDDSDQIFKQKVENILKQNKSPQLVFHKKKNDYVIEKEKIINDNGKYTIINFVGYHMHKIGKNSYKPTNPIWLVSTQTNEKFYLMYCNTDTFTIFSQKCLEKILIQNNSIPSWYKHTATGYICMHFEKTIKYLHQIILNYHGNGKGQNSVDHINQDKLDNRLNNLRVTTQSEQNRNRGKVSRKYNAQCLPSELVNYMKKKYNTDNLPKFVNFNTELRKKINGEYVKRSFFRIEKHPKLSKVINTSKSSTISIIKKYEEVIKILNRINNDIIPYKE
jgi:hypothetical protein